MRVAAIVAAGLALLTGACSLGLEVLLTRLLLSLTGSRIYAFSAMLAVFLAGLAAGSLFIAPRVLRGGERQPRSLLGVGLLVALCGAAVFLALLVCTHLGSLMTALSWLVPDPGYGYYTPLQALVASALVMFIPTLGLGAIFPVVIRMYRGEASGSSRAVGRIYFINTAGCVIGSLAGTFVLLPVLGTQRGLILVGSLLVAAGVAMFWFRPGGAALTRRPLRLGLTAAALVGVALIWQLPPDHLSGKIYRQIADIRQARVVHFNEGLNETIMVTEEQDLGRPTYRRLITNRESMSTTHLFAQRYMKLMAHLPALFTPAPRKALLICYGVGNTLDALTRHSSLEQIWVVDISAEVLSLSALFERTNHGAMRDPRVRVRVADGRHFLITNQQRFDVVTAEPPPPAARGVVNLYSREYYQLVRRRLNPGGTFAQWLPVTQTPPWEALTLIRAFVDVFPHAALLSGESSELILLGSDRPLKLSLPRLLARTEQPRLAADLRSIGVRDAFDLLATLTMGGDELRRRTRQVPPCSDNHPTIEYTDLSQLNPRFVVSLSQRQGDAAQLIASWGDTAAARARNRQRLASAVTVARSLKRMGIGLDESGSRPVYMRATALMPPPLTWLPDTPYVRALLDIQRSTLAAAKARLRTEPTHFRALFAFARQAYYRGDFATASKLLERLRRVHGDKGQLALYRKLTAHYLQQKK